jgi:hypothetical protein
MAHEAALKESSRNYEFAALRHARRAIVARGGSAVVQ